jgi:hypothetical protein
MVQAGRTKGAEAPFVISNNDREGRSKQRSASVFLAELVNTTAGINDLLLARVKRVAV